MVDTQISFECKNCGMTKTVPASQDAPTCCGEVMQEIAPQMPGAKTEGSCCGG